MHDRQLTDDPPAARRTRPRPPIPGPAPARPPALTAGLLAQLQASAGNRAAAGLVAVQAAGDPGVDPLLRRGSRGPAVELLQDHLVQAHADLAVDGIFGPITRAAVVAYQAAAGLAADGVVGPRTWASLKTGGVVIPVTPGAPFGEADLARRVASRLGTVASYLAPLATTNRAPATTTAPLAAHAAWSGPPVVARQADGPGGPVAHGGEPGPGPAGSSDVVTAAAQVTGLLARIDPATAAEMGPAGAATGSVASGLVDGSLPLDQAVVQLDTVATQLGEFAANQAGQATGSGSTTVRVVSDTTYPITGTTIAEVGTALEQRMSTHGEAASVSPHVADDGTVPGIEVSYDEVSAAGKVTKATVTLELDRVLPEWTKASSTACACWKKEWDRFEAAIKAHEQEHVNIYTRMLTGLHLKFVGKTTTQADAVFDQVFKATEQAQADFDTRTRNGREPPPGTTFNAGTPCAC